MIFEENSKAIIKLGYSCNNNCLFCWTERFGNLKIHNSSTKEIIAKIDLAKKLNVNTIVFSGGEPTIRKDIFEISSYVQSSGFKLGLATNARMLSNEFFLRKLTSYGLNYLHISFHSHLEEIHNHITKTNSFEQTILGIKNGVKLNSIIDNFSKNKIFLIINLILTNRNIDTLDSTIEFLYNIGVRNIKLSMIEYSGNALKNPDILLTLSKAANKINDVFLKFNHEDIFDISNNFSDLNLYFDGIPFCLINEQNRFCGLKELSHKYMSESFEDKLYLVDILKYIKLDICTNCSNKNCVGISEEYVKYYGLKKVADELINCQNRFL